MGLKKQSGLNGFTLTPGSGQRRHLPLASSQNHDSMAVHTVKCPSCNPVADETAAKMRSLVYLLVPLLGQQGAPARDPVPAYAGFFPMTVEENQAVPALIRLSEKR